MHITVAAVGRWKTCPEQALWQEYTKRTPWNITLKEVEEKRPLSGEKRKNREGELLETAIPRHAYRIILDERGKTLKSHEFATKLREVEEQGRPLALVIGGADGHSDAMRDSADFLLSFGSMTWPHVLVRAMVAEQLYRSYTILTGHPYHRA